MSRTLALAAVLFTLALPLLRAEEPKAEDESYTAEITDLKGKVELKRHEGKDFKAAEKGDELAAGDAVRTGADGACELTLDGTSIIMLDKNSEFVLGEAKKAAGLGLLNFGGILSKFNKLGKGRVFKVKTPSAVASIRGTEFGVYADSEASKVGVFDEGEVQVTGPSEEGGVTLRPNTETSVAPGGEPLPATSLKFFAFHQERMKQIRGRLDYLRKNWKKKNDDRREQLKKRLDRFRRK